MVIRERDIGLTFTPPRSAGARQPLPLVQALLPRTGARLQEHVLVLRHAERRPVIHRDRLLLRPLRLARAVRPLCQPFGE